jgi:hypothetical protein
MIVFQFITLLQLAAGNWLLTNCKYFENDRISIYFLMATGYWQLANRKCSMMILLPNISIVFLFISILFPACNRLFSASAKVVNQNKKIKCLANFASLNLKKYLWSKKVRCARQIR